MWVDGTVALQLSQTLISTELIISYFLLMTVYVYCETEYVRIFFVVATLDAKMAMCENDVSANGV